MDTRRAVHAAIYDMKEAVLALHQEAPPEMMQDVRKRWNALVEALREHDPTLVRH